MLSGSYMTTQPSETHRPRQALSKRTGACTLIAVSTETMLPVLVQKLLVSAKLSYTTRGPCISVEFHNGEALRTRKVSDCH